MNRLRNQLALRIAALVISFMGLLGVALYFLVLAPLSEFVEDGIEQDLISLSREVFNICNDSFDELLLSGNMGDEKAITIKKALTLGEIEDFFRIESILGRVVDWKTGRVLLQTKSVPRLPESEKRISRERIHHFSGIHGNFYGYVFTFSPWNWRITIYRAREDYNEILKRAHRLYLIIPVFLVIGTILFVLVLIRNIKKPVDDIITAIKNGRPPDYRGIDVFTFLSDTISGMMASLSQSEEKYRSLVETTSDWIWQVDTQGTYLYTSPRVETLLGYRPDQIVGKKISDLMSPRDSAVFSYRFRTFVSSESHFSNIEKRCLHADGYVVTLETSGRPVFSVDGTLLGFRGIDRDITERKKTEKALRESEKKLSNKKRMEAIGLMAGGIAHDLNNIFSGIVTYPEFLLMKLHPDDPLRKPLTIIRESAKRAADIVSDLLTIARGVATAKEIHDLNGLATQYLESPELEKLKESRPEVEILTRFSPEEIYISCSPSHIKKAVMNLVMNGFEAISNDGTITLSTKRILIESGPDVPENMKSGPYALLSVEDSGSGISKEDIQRIFEPFYTRKILGRTGTGLGLTTVWNAVKDHGGHIDVRSNGRGTCFDLYFPLAKGKPDTKSRKTDMKILQGTGEHVLVIEDDEAQRIIASELLRDLGYRVSTVSSGEAAVEFVENEIPDILLLDMIMDPGMNGRETYERIIEINPGQKAVIASGYAETEDVKSVIRMGGGGFVKKPYAIGDLGEAIKKALGNENTETNPQKNNFDSV